MEKRSSLGGKFVNTMLLVGGIIAACALVVVIVLGARRSAEHVAVVRRDIEDGFVSKGKILAAKHAHALRGLALDSGSADIRSLVDRTVQEDPDVVYGLYVDAGGEALAFALRGAGSPDRSAWRQLALAPRELLALQPQAKRTTRLGQNVLEVAVPVRGDEGEVLGTIRYGLSTSRIDLAVASAKREAEVNLMHSPALFALAVGAVASLGLWLGLRRRGNVPRSVPMSS